LVTRNKLSGSIRIRPLWGFLLAALLLALLSSYLQMSPFVRDLEHRFQTRYFLFASFFETPETGSIPLVLVLINDQSLPQGSSRSPIEREWLAALIRGVSSHGPALIGLNINLDRPLTTLGDRLLADAIASAGNVIIRSDPLYPAIQLFTQAALDAGTVRFRADSSGAVGEACHGSDTCRSSCVFYDRLLQHYLGERYDGMRSGDGSGWLRIAFSPARTTDASRYVQFPLFYAHDLDRMPAGSLKNKIVLIGAGFPDLYPLFRTPLPGAEQFMQETELLAHTIDTVAGNRQIEDQAPSVTGLWLFALLSILSLLVVRRGIIAGTSFATVLIPVLFILAAVAFARFQTAIPFVLPAVAVIAFLAGSAIQQILEERFHRLTAELHLKQSKIDFLTNELHTHHLFNELSRLNVMISRQPETARAYLVEFAELLRASLKYGDQARVPVSVQLEYLRTYLQQQKIIHGDRFRFAIEADGSWQEVQVPWHVFFPLVENAAKAAEGVMRTQPAATATIAINLRRVKDGLLFRIENPFAENGGGTSTQKGLANLKDRLKWSYPKGGYELSGGPQGSTWIATLQLPLD